MIFFTSHFYSLGKQYGQEQAMRRLDLEIQSPGAASPPAVKTIARLRQMDDVHVRNDCGATSIGRARSRAFHDAFASPADVWVTCDDDVEATSITLRWMLEAVKASNGVCLVPYVLRLSEQQIPTSSVMLYHSVEDTVHELSNGGRAVGCKHGGLGLMAMSRYAMQETVAANQDLVWRDDDGIERLALFHEALVEGQWFGEDLSFFRRIPDHVAVECLVTGDSAHGGVKLTLENVMLSHIAQSKGLV